MLRDLAVVVSAFVLALVAIMVVAPVLFGTSGSAISESNGSLWSTVWARSLVVFTIGGLLVVALGPVAGSHIQGIALALAAAAPIYGGLKTARNAHGEADALAEHGWARQGIRVKSPVAQARALGLALALFGVFCVFLGLVLAVG